MLDEVVEERDKLERLPLKGVLVEEELLWSEKTSKFPLLLSFSRLSS